MPIDSRWPCFSCDRKDLKLESCPKCRHRVCDVCWKLHEWEHTKDHKASEDKDNKPPKDSE